MLPGAVGLVLAGFELGPVEYGAAMEAFEQSRKPERSLELFDDMVSEPQAVYEQKGSAPPWYPEGFGAASEGL